MDASHTAVRWYLRTPNGLIYGPAGLATLCDWVSDGRMMPADQVSPDGTRWAPAPSIHILNMYWNHGIPLNPPRILHSPTQHSENLPGTHYVRPEPRADMHRLEAPARDYTDPEPQYGLQQQQQREIEKLTALVEKLRQQVRASARTIENSSRTMQEQKEQYEALTETNAQESTKLKHRLDEFRRKSQDTDRLLARVRKELEQHKSNYSALEQETREKEQELGERIKQISDESESKAALIEQLRKDLKKLNGSRPRAEAESAAKEKDFTEALDGLRSALKNRTTARKETRGRTTEQAIPSGSDEEYPKPPVQNGKWYVRTQSNAVYGPEALHVLRDWAAQCRISPGCEISQDRINWLPVESIPELAMEWTVETTEGETYGPVNSSAIGILIREGVLTPSAKVFNRRTKQASLAGEEAAEVRL